MMRQVVLAAAVAMIAAPAFAQSAPAPLAVAPAEREAPAPVAATPLPTQTPAASPMRQVGAGGSGCSWSSAKAYPTS